MFKRKTIQLPNLPYDCQKQKPIIRASICTGEQVAGFKDRVTGKFTEVMLIKDVDDLNTFLRLYNIQPSEITKEY